MKEIDFDFEKFELSDHEVLSSNMNFVARIKSVGVIKITPPDGALARFPNIKLYEDRIFRDWVFNNYCKICPEIISFDLSKKYFLMEDLGPTDMRKLLRNSSEIEAQKVLKKLNVFLKNLDKFYSNQKDLPGVFLEDNPLVKDHYAHIFEYPLFDHGMIELIWKDIGLSQIEIDLLNQDYRTLKEMNITKFIDYESLKGKTLIHGDLHTGSLIEKKDKVFLIDGEFAHLGNKDFDIGMLYANLVIDLTLSGNDLSMLKKINLVDLSELALKVTSFEIIRQMIGASFSTPIKNTKAREQLIKFVQELNSSLN